MYEIDINLDCAIPTVALNLSNPFCYKIFNFNYIVSSIDVDKFIAVLDSLP